jgi:CzcA family heavy metal efflux pump
VSVAAWAHRHARPVIFVVAVLAAAGLLSVFRLPVGLFPQVDFPRIRVSLDAGSRPAERMEIEVTRPVEEAVRGIPGVRNLRSTTSRGSADVDVDFEWGLDMVAAALQVNAEISRVLPSLPPGTAFEVRRMDPTVFPVIAYSLTSGTRSPVELRNLASYQLRPTLAAVPGVAKVGIEGGGVEEFRVTVAPGKLQSLDMTLADVARALSASNVLVAVGKLQDHDKLYLVVSDTRFRSLSEISQTILRPSPDGIVTLEDVATVVRTTEPQFTRVTAGGHDAVLLSIYQQPAGNTVQIARDIKEKLAELGRQLPDLRDGSVQVANWYDQSQLILASEGSVRDAILIGVALAAAVLFIFLRNAKVTLIATLAVPSVLAATLLILYVFHMSLNIMTLGGMAAAVGLIVDDGIVMLEHITRRLRIGSSGDSPGKDERTRVVDATGEFTEPLVGSSSSTIIIFVPLAFLSGVTGAFFKALSLTMAASLFISFVVAWFGIPILAAHWLGPNDAKQEEGKRVAEALGAGYRAFMRPLLTRPWLSLVIAASLLGLGYLALQRLPSGFMPAMDEGGFILDYNAPPGTSLAETDRELRRVEAIVSANPAVETYARRTGLQLGGGVTEANQGDFFIRLTPFPRPPIDRVMDQIRADVERTVPALRIGTSQLMEDLIGDLTGVPQPIEIKLFSSDEKTLLDLAPKVAKAIAKVDGVVEVKDGIVPAGDALDIEVDRIKAALEGVDPDAVTRLLTDALTGTVTTQVLEGPRLIGVRVWLPPDVRGSERDVRDLRLRAPDGHLFPLARVATLTVLTGQPEITRENLERMVAVTGRISGRDLGSTIADVKKVLSAPELLPTGVTYTLGGLYQQQQIAFRGLLTVLVAALLLVFTLLLYLYERFRVAIAILATTVLAMMAVLLGLWVTGTELNIMSIMGMTMIVGIVTEVGIFYYSEYAGLSSELPARERLLSAGVTRMRAIAMTTIAAILALMVLALGIGQGSAMLQPLAIAIVVGLLAQLPLVLVVLPAFLVLLGSAK